MRKILRNVVLTLLVVFWFALSAAPARAADPRDALSARGESSLYLTLRLNNMSGMVKSVLSLIDADALAKLADSEQDVDALRLAMALAAQIPAQSVALAAGMGAEGPFLQAAVSLPEDALSQLPLIAEGKATPEVVTMTLLGQAALPFAGILKPTVQQGEKGPYYALADGILTLSARDNMAIIGASPNDLYSSLASLSGGPETRLADKRRFKGDDYFFLHLDMALAAALAGDAAKGEGAAEALALFKAPLELEATFDTTPGAFVASFAANVTEALPALAYLKDLKTARGGNLFQAGGGSLFFGLAGQIAFDPAIFQANPQVAEAWGQLLAALQPVGITEEDLKNLLSGTISLAAGNAASVFGQNVPGVYVAIQGASGAATAILNKILGDPRVGQSLPLIPIKVEGWSSLHAMNPQAVPASVALGVRGDDTLFLGLAEAPRLNEKPRLSSAAEAFLNESFLAGSFFDGGAIWKWLRDEAANPGPMVQQALQTQPRAKEVFDEVLGAELAVDFMKLWSPSVETFFVELSLADVPPEKALAPRLMNAYRIIAETTESGGSEPSGTTEKTSTTEKKTSKTETVTTPAGVTETKTTETVETTTTTVIGPGATGTVGK
jgi:hypothetical protein